MAEAKQQDYLGKRYVDLILGCALAVPALPIGILAAIAIKLTSCGPVLYWQQRVGWNGREFRLCKFRTMSVVPEGTDLEFPGDRITPVGRWLRRLSIDELPQLVNVFLGDMSIVGPRPALAYQVARYSDRQRKRLAVRPGITGLAQVRGRNALLWADRIEFDLDYVARSSVAIDLRLCLETVLVLTRGSGVSGHDVDDPISRDPS